MSQSQAQAERQQKIQTARQQLEDNGGKTIKPEKIQELALLEIAELLYGINVQLTRMNLSRSTGSADLTRMG